MDENILKVHHAFILATFFQIKGFNFIPKDAGLHNLKSDCNYGVGYL
jgi:hypothetical protein